MKLPVRNDRDKGMHKGSPDRKERLLLIGKEKQLRGSLVEGFLRKNATNVPGDLSSTSERYDLFMGA